jgi:hypothetical protein
VVTDEGELDSIDDRHGCGCIVARDGWSWCAGLDKGGSGDE